MTDSSNCSLIGDCSTAGKSVIAAATFAMLFGILSVIFIHLYTTCKDRCRFPFPRIFLLVSNFLSLCLYITVVATWYSKCQNEFNDCNTDFGSFSGVTPGYCIATAIVCIVMSFFAWAYSFWRTCWPNKDEPAEAKSSGGYGAQASASDLGAGAASPAAAKAPYTAAETPTAGGGGSRGGYSNGGGGGGAYGGGQTYGNDDDDGGSGPAYGGGGGGYGGSYGGAYGGSGGGAYGGNSSKQQSAYGY